VREGTTVAHREIMATNVRLSHPRLIPVERSRRPPHAQPEGWTRSDTWFVVLVLVAVAVCASISIVAR
jgi:hypothetical protein